MAVEYCIKSGLLKRCFWFRKRMQWSRKEKVLRLPTFETLAPNKCPGLKQARACANLCTCHTSNYPKQDRAYHTENGIRVSGHMLVHSSSRTP
eukprot:1142509-Pelagomonas_calceolata.AAC.1